MNPTDESPARPEVIADWAATITRGAQRSLVRIEVTLMKAEDRVADLRESQERRRQAE